MTNWLELYHSLPVPLRSMAASLRGYYLRWWRYGPETEILINEALERESWGAQRWKAWQEERLAHVLHRAATRVPHYRKLWAERRRMGDKASWEYLENWPILDKETLRSNPRAFIADDQKPQKMFEDRTSGTTGTPLSIFLTRNSLTRWYALFEARIRLWHSVSIKEPWAMMGGQMIAPFHQKQPPFWILNVALNQLYLSTHHLSKNNAEWYADALRKHKPTHMIAYPSSASVLANCALEQSLDLPKLDVFFSNAEPLLNTQKEVISEAFNCPVVDTYGMGEYVVGASECQHGKMHLWPEVGLVEVIDDNKNTKLERGVGRLITTGLLNADMPLIRYEVGDRSRLLKGVTCECGRSLPILGNIEGRLNDLLITRDGRRIFWLNPTFYGMPIREAQIIQESLDRLRVRYVPAPECSPDTERSIIERIQNRMGSIEVVMEPVVEVPREANGKFRPVISALSQDEVEQVDRPSLLI